MCGCGRSPNGPMFVEKTGTPTIELDGKIKFPDPKLTPVITGYRGLPDGTLEPTWDACQHRRTRILFRRTGEYQVANVCANKKHEQYRFDVSPEDCKQCPLRE